MVSLHPVDMSLQSDAAELIRCALKNYGRIDVLYNKRRLDLIRLDYAR